MKNILYILFFYLTIQTFAKAQSNLLIDNTKSTQNKPAPVATPTTASKPNQNTQSTATVTPLKTKIKINKHEGKVLSNGFALTAIVGGTRGLTNDGKYTLNNYGNYYNTYDYYSLSTNYELENSFGYRAGIGIGFQTRGYGFEVPFTLNVDRFKVPKLDKKNSLRVSSFEMGINNYFKFLKAKHFIVFGPYVAFDSFIDDLGLHSWGANLGYGFNFTKRLNLSLRYKFNIFSVTKGYGENTAIYFEKDDTNAGESYLPSRKSQYNSLQLVLRFDLINTRRWKDPKVKNASYNSSYTPTPVAPAKIAINYSTYTDENLKIALKDAKNLTDMNLIQIEIDKRKKTIPVNEFDKYSDAQLKELLNEAVAKEDYDKAEILKNQIIAREVIQKNKPIDPNSLEAKSIEELNELLNAAVAKEDYDKAAEIKAIIDKKK